MRSLLVVVVLCVSLLACRSGDSDRSESDTSVQGLDPSTGGGAGGNTNNIGSDTIRSIADTSKTDTTKKDTLRK